MFLSSFFSLSYIIELNITLSRRFISNAGTKKGIVCSSLTDGRKANRLHEL